MSLQALSKLKEATKAFEAAKATAKDALVEAIKEVFQKHPEIASIGWCQYAPHFNDGDPCVFRVHEPAVMLIPELHAKLVAGEKLTGLEGVVIPKAGVPDGDEPCYEDDSSLYPISRRRWASDVLDRTVTPFEQALVDDIDALFGISDDFFESAFGSDSKVIATPKGIETFEYDHD